MQKIVLQRLNLDGSRHYLSAVGPSTGAGASQAAPSQTGTQPLHFQSPRIRQEKRDGLEYELDEVDDYLCWTIVGICMSFNINS